MTVNLSTLRDTLIGSLSGLAEAGKAADILLVEAQARQAIAPSADEQGLQTLGALSREIWRAHTATLTAIAATRQYERVGQ